jgi:hypothetical protein
VNFPSKRIYLKKDLIKIEEADLIAEMELNAEVLNDRKAIAGNILRFDLIIILQLIYRR